jgi:hypothetical protein
MFILIGQRWKLSNLHSENHYCNWKKSNQSRLTPFPLTSTQNATTPLTTNPSPRPINTLPSRALPQTTNNTQNPPIVPHQPSRFSKSTPKTPLKLPNQKLNGVTYLRHIFSAVSLSKTIKMLLSPVINFIMRP